MMAEVSGRQGLAVRDAARVLATARPPIWSLVEHMHRDPPTGDDHAERWDPETCRFMPTLAGAGAGAFRTSRFGRRYVVRVDEEPDSDVLVGDARVVKHLAAVVSGKRLVGYDAETQTLYVPLGADLPGLWGRAAVLCSGSRPVVDESDSSFGTVMRAFGPCAAPDRSLVDPIGSGRRRCRLARFRPPSTTNSAPPT